MIFFEVKDGTVREEQLVVKGRPATFRRQEAWLSLNGEVRKVRLSLGRELAAYVVGRYVLDESSFGVNQYGDFVVSRLILRPAPAASPVVAGK